MFSNMTQYIEVLILTAPYLLFMFYDSDGVHRSKNLTLKFAMGVLPFWYGLGVFLFDWATSPPSTGVPKIISLGSGLLVSLYMLNRDISLGLKIREKIMEKEIEKETPEPEEEKESEEE